MGAVIKHPVNKVDTESSLACFYLNVSGEEYCRRLLAVKPDDAGDVPLQAPLQEDGGGALPPAGRRGGPGEGPVAPLGLALLDSYC